MNSSVKEDSNFATVNSQTLSNSFTDFEVKYAGIIPEIPSEVDPTCRTQVLRILDEGKKKSFIPKNVQQTQDAILSMNAYSIRILSKENKELLLQVPIHMLAAVSCVKEDDLNILGIKIGLFEIGEVGGNKEVNDLAVVYCDTSKMAEDICAMFGHCFQLIFFEATTQFFDKKTLEGAGSAIGFASRSGSVASTAPAFQGRAFLTGSIADQSDRTSGYAVDLIQEYLRMLHALLNSEELKQFAVLLKRWRADNLPLPEFCQKVLELYGSERKYLLARMRPFIPDNDIPYFESFLGQYSVTDNAECSLPSWSPAGSFEGVSLGKPSDAAELSLPPSAVSTVSPAESSTYLKTLHGVSPQSSRKPLQQLRPVLNNEQATQVGDVQDLQSADNSQQPNNPAQVLR